MIKQHAASCRTQTFSDLHCCSIRQIPGSNLVPETLYTDRDFRVSPQFHQAGNAVLSSTKSQTLPAPFLPIPSLTNYPTILMFLPCILRTSVAQVKVICHRIPYGRHTTTAVRIAF